jgi:plastocyanin
MFSKTMSHALLAAALVLAAPLPALAADANTVVMKNFDFSPMTLTVNAGTTVTWRNMDGEPHTVVSADGAFRSAALDSNESFAFKFDKPGVYKYVCSIHPKMMASIIVK